MSARWTFHASQRAARWAIVGGLGDQNENRDAQRLLTELGQHPDPDIANAARESLSH